MTLRVRFLKKATFVFISVCLICSSLNAQKLNEPVLLGSLIAGEDPSEFLLHRVMEWSEEGLKVVPNGKLIARICGFDDFSTAFVKSAFSPLAASNYNIMAKRIIVPFEKIFIAKSSKCTREKDFVFTQYWFVPDKNTLEFDEIYPVSNITYKSFDTYDYDFENNKYKNTNVEEKQFDENIAGFISELKFNQNAEGFIVYNSKNKTIRRNIEKVKSALRKENININQVKMVVKVRLDVDKNEKLVPIKDEKRYFPDLEVLTIKQ
jgi:hypothetical protein